MLNNLELASLPFLDFHFQHVQEPLIYSRASFSFTINVLNYKAGFCIYFGGSEGHTFTVLSSVTSVQIKQFTLSFGSIGYSAFF